MVLINQIHSTMNNFFELLTELPWWCYLIGMAGVWPVPYFIKMVRDGGKNRLVVGQGRSATDIAQQPKDGFKRREDALKHKDDLIKKGSPFSFRLPKRYPHTDLKRRRIRKNKDGDTAK